MCTSCNYKGMIIYENDDSQFSKEYFSAVNPFKEDENGRKLHAHATTKGAAKKVVDCFHRLRFGKDVSRYSLSIRNKAMRMLGYYIKSKN